MSGRRCLYTSGEAYGRGFLAYFAFCKGSGCSFSDVTLTSVSLPSRLARLAGVPGVEQERVTRENSFLEVKGPEDCLGDTKAYFARCVEILLGVVGVAEACALESSASMSAQDRVNWRRVGQTSMEWDPTGGGRHFPESRVPKLRCYHPFVSIHLRLSDDADAFACKSILLLTIHPSILNVDLQTLRRFRVVSSKVSEMGTPFYRPAPRPPGAFQNQVLPDTNANWISRISFSWITPLLKVSLGSSWRH